MFLVWRSKRVNCQLEAFHSAPAQVHFTAPRDLALQSVPIREAVRYFCDCVFVYLCICVTSSTLWRHLTQHLPKPNFTADQDCTLQSDRNPWVFKEIPKWKVSMEMKSWIHGKIKKIKKSNCQLDGGTNRCRPNTRFPSTKG